MTEKEGGAESHGGRHRPPSLSKPLETPTFRLERNMRGLEQCAYSCVTHGDRSREFLERPIDNLSLTANDGGGAISINNFKNKHNEKSKV